MKKLNYNVALCKTFDDETKTAVGFVNEIKAEGNKAHITFFNMISGYEGEDEIQFDYGLMGVDVEDEKYNGMGSYLLTLSMKKSNASEEKRTSQKLKSLDGMDKFQEIGACSRIVTFPCKGCYELRVYLVDEEDKGMEAKERIKKYAQEGSDPISTYSFRVV